MTPQVYTLPPPPSTNAIWRVFAWIDRKSGRAKGRVIKSEAYRKWLEHAGAEIAVQRYRSGLRNVYRIAGPIELHLDVGYNARRDLSNYLKPIEDLLQYSKVIENDKQVKKISMNWAEGVTDCRIEVLPYDARVG